MKLSMSFRSSSDDLRQLNDIMNCLSCDLMKFDDLAKQRIAALCRWGRTCLTLPLFGFGDFGCKKTASATPLRDQCATLRSTNTEASSRVFIKVHMVLSLRCTRRPLVVFKAQMLTVIPAWRIFLTIASVTGPT